ncbi:MAG: hypothetical protein IJ569_05820 [Prevotella sp.]|nr:hypothetical protein [Prevotella sp.]
MKKMMMTLMAMMMITVSANAMSFEQARNEALFLTDKMAYELNLTDEQYEAAYEINLDYLMGVTGRNNVFGTYWERRNLDLSYILLDWQWNAFLAASYFYRPLYWEAGYWHFGIYARYPHRDYFYFGRPHFYATYRGGHAWHIHTGRGYYYGRRDHFRTPVGRTHIGMHDRWNRGDFRGGHHSSTRITGRPESRGRIGNNRGYSYDNNRGMNRSSVGSNRLNNRQIEGHGTYNRGGNQSLGSSSRSLGSNNRSLGNSNRSTSRSNFSAPSRNFGGSTPSMGSSRSSSMGSSHSSFGGSRSGSFGGSSRGSSFSGGQSGGSHSSGSHSGGHTGSRR